MPSVTKTVKAATPTTVVTEADPNLYSRTDRARVWARGLTNEYDVPGVDTYRQESGLTSFVQAGKVTKKAACEAGRLIAVIEDQVNNSTSYTKRELVGQQNRLENLDATIEDEIAEHERAIERIKLNAENRRRDLETNIAQYQASVDAEDEAAQRKIERAVEVRGAILEELAKTDED